MIRGQTYFFLPARPRRVISRPPVFNEDNQGNQVVDPKAFGAVLSERPSSNLRSLRFLLLVFLQCIFIDLCSSVAKRILRRTFKEEVTRESRE